MNRLLLNRSVLNTNFLIRNYSVQPITSPLRNIVKELPISLVYRPILYQFSTNCLKQFTRKNASYAPININPSTLTKDVIVFKYNNPNYFRIMNFFGIIQFFFWLICSELTLSTLRDTPIDEKDPNLEEKPLYFRINLGENKYKYGLAFSCFGLGKEQFFEIIFKDFVQSKYVILFRRFCDSWICVDVYIEKCSVFDFTKRW